MSSTGHSIPPALLPTHDVLGALHRATDRSVWRVSERGTGTEQVLKLVHPGAVEALRRGIAEEYLLLERIRHPHWVRPLAFVNLADGSRGYLMEHLDGAPPRDIRSPGWEPQDLEGGRGVLGALAMLHAIGYVHLDLKPSQILNVPGRGAVLIDPGLAARVGSAVEPRGTWGFIAPEVLRGSPWDGRADLYGFASLLVFLWTGETPLGEGEIATQVRRQMKRPNLRLRDRLEELPEGMDYIIESLLDPDPERRPRTAATAWRALHTIAGYRDFYLERERLPRPSDLPLYPPGDAEQEWDRTVAGSGPDRWAIEGQVGSGRHRLLAWFRARAEVLGAKASLGRDLLNVTADDGRLVSCRIGTGEASERTVHLGGVGEEAATAALEAFGLEREGDEARWAWEVLRLRLEERVGGEAERRRSGRGRRTIAAGISSELARSEAARLARLLAAVSEKELPHAGEGDIGLMSRGLVRVDEGGRLRGAIPPWDLDSLRVIAGDGEVASAHRGFLSSRSPDPLAIARHALVARDAARLRESINGALDALRDSGDAVGAHDLLVDAGELLGPAFVRESLPMRARLVLERGVAPGLALLNERRGDLPPGWRDLIDGHMAFRARRYDEAAAIAREQVGRSSDPALRSAAMMMLIRSLHQSGRYEEALALGLPIVRSRNSSGISDWLPVAVTLLTLLVHSGESREALNELMTLVEGAIPSADRRMRELAANAIGSEAFRRGDWPRATRFLRMEIETAEEIGEPASVCLAKMSLAGISFIEGRVAECEALNREALLLAEQIASTRYIASILTNIGTVLEHTGRFDEALAVSRRSRVLHESAGDRELALHSRAIELTTLANAGLLRAGRAVFDDLVVALPGQGQPLGAGVRFDMGQIARCEGKIEEARAHLHESLDIARVCRAKDEIARDGFSLALLDLASGRPEISAKYLQAAEADYQSSPSAEIRPLRDFAGAAYSAAAGDRSRAMAHLRSVRDTARESGRLPWLWKSYAAEAMLARRSGESRSGLDALASARLALSEMLEAIRNEALRESYVLLPDPHLFLSWCELDKPPDSMLPGSADLLSFLR